MLSRAEGGTLAAAIAPSVVHLLRDAAREAPDAPAVSFESDSVTYREYAGLVAGLARCLREHGAAGERVAVILPNSLTTAVALFAAQAAGAQVVPVNPFYTARELDLILHDADPRIVISDPVSVPAAAGLDALSKCVRIETGDGFLDPAWRTLPPDALDEFLPAPNSLAMLQYTGGTTGRSKGVDIRHIQVTTNIEQREARLPTRAGTETVLCMMPLFHVFAQTMCLYLAVRARSRLLILPRYKPDAVMAAIRNGVTIFPAGPTVFTGLLQTPGFADLDFTRLYACYSGSAPLPEEILRRWKNVTGAFIYEGYGQTEAGPVLTYVGPHTAQKAGSVGPPLPDTIVEIVDLAERTKVLPLGAQGEIRARGPQIMAGYRNLPDETAEALADGWLYTGDIGELDADGFLFIRDRKKDLVIVGGYNVYPREVDEVLFAHPEVMEAAAFGKRDGYYGEIIVVKVVLRAGGAASADDLIAHCRQNLAPYKVPRQLDVVDALPKTAAGKIDKGKLREE